jgi:hypothetical protein
MLIEEALPGSFDIKFAFNHWTLGEDFCKEELDITEEQLSDHNFDMLRYLGFQQRANSGSQRLCLRNDDRRRLTHT